MIDSELLTILASAGAVAALVGFSWLLGFRGRLRLTEEGIRAALADAASGAAVAELTCDARGRSALAWLADGRVAVLLAMGDRISVRFAKASNIKIHRSGALRVAVDDPGFPPFVLRPGPDGVPARLLQRTEREATA